MNTQDHSRGGYLPDDPPDAQPRPRDAAHSQRLPSDDGELGPSSADLPNLGPSIELIRRFQAGSHEALGLLFQRYEGRLLRIIRARMSPRLRSLVEPEDLLQETLLLATKKAPTTIFESHAGILRWFSSIAHHRILDKVSYYAAMRRDSQRNQQGGNESDTQRGGFDPAAPSVDSPSKIVQRQEFQELVDHCVQELDPEEYREAILQRDYYGATWEDMAERLGRETPGAARELYRRARIKLGTRLEPLLGGDFDPH